MITGKETKFNGFSGKTPVFLQNLKANNNRLWFEAHRQDYDKYLLEPLRNLVTDMGEFMLTIDPFFEISPGIDKTISRIYRDTRFSGDKSPFKSSLWITFKRPGRNWQDDPAYFFEITPDSYRYGMGFYSASKYAMDRFREKIDKKQKKFLKAISFFSEQQIFVIEGDKYKRILDSNMPEYIRNWYQRRNLYLVCNREIDNRLFSRGLVDDLISGFNLLSPFYDFLRKLKINNKGNENACDTN